MKSAQHSKRAELVERLYERDSGVLLWYVASLTPSREDAEEAVQEAYLRLLTVPGLEHEETRVRSYLFKVARNLVCDFFRRRQARCEHLHTDIDAVDLRSDEPGPDDVVEEGICVEAVQATLERSLPRPRQAFLMHFDEQMTYQCIAEELGVSKKTVERDIAMVLELCRSRLGA